MSPPGPAPVPTAPVRFNSWLVRIDHLLARLDGFLKHHLPAEGDPLGQAGRMANLALLVAVVSGVALLFWYSSSLHQAHASLAALEGRTLGGWVRALHRYSSDLVMLFLLLHAGRMFFARKFTGSRWLPWVSGVGLVGVIWFIGWTGFWLVWDQPAQKIATTSMRFLDALPIFGEPLSRLYLADRLVPSLLFFVIFFLHMLLPLLIAVGLVIHLLRLNRVRLLPDRRLIVFFSLVLALTAWLVPAPLDAPARMAEKTTGLTVDAWYLTPLALALRLRAGGLWIALGGVTVLGAGLPWLLGRRLAVRVDDQGKRLSADFQTVVEPERCHACTQCLQDCPFDAIRMVPRTDGKRLAHQAWVDPSRCVGCAVCVGSCDSEAMHLPWFDAVAVEPRIQAGVASALASGEIVQVALVAADISGGMEFFDTAKWSAHLPGYQVHAVPTASWVRPKFVERLLASGVARVLIVRDARAEAAARDGNQWIQERLAGARAPVFRPARLNGAAGEWLVVDFDPSAPNRLKITAESFARHGTPDARLPWTLRRAAALVVCLATIAAATVALSHLRVVNPEPAAPELAVSFKAFGERTATAPIPPRDDPNVPVHMRGAPGEKPHRSPVRVRLTINGTAEERTYAGKGLSHDGPAIDVWRHLLEPGTHRVRVELFTTDSAKPECWDGEIEARPRHIHVLTYDPAHGFRLE